MDMVADKEVDKAADMVAGQWSRVLVTWAQTFSTRTFKVIPDMRVF